MCGALPAVDALSCPVVTSSWVPRAQARRRASLLPLRRQRQRSEVIHQVARTCMWNLAGALCVRVCCVASWAWVLRVRCRRLTTLFVVDMSSVSLCTSASMRFGCRHRSDSVLRVQAACLTVMRTAIADRQPRIAEAVYRYARQSRCAPAAGTLDAAGVLCGMTTRTCVILTCCCAPRSFTVDLALLETLFAQLIDEGAVSVVARHTCVASRLCGGRCSCLHLCLRCACLHLCLCMRGCDVVCAHGSRQCVTGVRVC